MRKSFFSWAVILIMLVPCLPALADAPDIVMQAMQDEMARSKNALNLMAILVHIFSLTQLRNMITFLFQHHAGR